MQKTSTEKELPLNTDRRAFFKRLAQFAGVFVAVSSASTVHASIDAITSSVSSKIDPKWREFFAYLKDYITSSYIKRDEDARATAFKGLQKYGIRENDVSPLLNINRCLIPKHLFLTHVYNDLAAAMPAIKVFSIHQQDAFDGFFVDGRKQTSIFGKEIGRYERVLLGDQVFSTYDIPPAATPCKVEMESGAKPQWVIAIPYLYIQGLYRRHKTEIVNRLVEELTIHEIAHIIYDTRHEVIPFLAQFGYRMDEGIRIAGVEDILRYLETRPQTYHQTERLILERIYNADLYYASSANSSHLVALTYIREGLIGLCDDIHRKNPKYYRNMLKISDQQCYASMECLCRKVIHQQGKQQTSIFNMYTSIR